MNISSPTREIRDRSFGISSTAKWLSPVGTRKSGAREWITIPKEKRVTSWKLYTHDVLRELRTPGEKTENE